MHSIVSRAGMVYQAPYIDNDTPRDLPDARWQRVSNEPESERRQSPSTRLDTPTHCH